MVQRGSLVGSRVSRTRSRRIAAGLRQFVQGRAAAIRGRKPEPGLVHNGDFLLEESDEGLGLLARQEGEMATANSIVIKDAQTIPNRARAAIEAYTLKSGKPFGPGSDPVSQVRHLDVDAVLARSLPKVVSE